MAQTTELSGNFAPKTEKPFAYRPTDPLFWGKIETLLAAADFSSVVIEGANQTKRSNESSADGAEGRLATAMGLSRKGLTFGATLLLIDLAKSRSGTSVGEAALYELQQLTLAHNYDRDNVDALMNSNEFGPLHPDIQSFVSFYRYLYNLRYGFNRWAETQKVLIKKDSPSDFELRYWTAIGDVARNKTDKAQAILKEIYASPLAPTRVKQRTQVQLARLAFERGQFNEAHELYHSLPEFGVREKGRMLLETAWTKYYLKSYDKALGLLNALRAPYFAQSLTPERYVLEILIYRDLCQYDAVESAVKKFKAAFRNSFRAIRQRAQLRQDTALVNLALMDLDLQDKANLIDQLRREREELLRSGWKGLAFYKAMNDEYLRRDRTLRRELDLQLEPRTREIAESFLDTEEQIQFLDYTSKLDALRIVRDGEDRDYQSAPISYLTFESIYWPVEDEFWWDEFKFYKVLISSQCKQSKSRKEEKMEREFE